jgi:hypothetical protein
MYRYKIRSFSVDDAVTGYSMLSLALANAPRMLITLKTIGTGERDKGFLPVLNETILSLIFVGGLLVNM